jgi:diguanylate cyclase (GGDEF)-like protein/PAS domain S-box-containing protein
MKTALADASQPPDPLAKIWEQGLLKTDLGILLCDANAVIFANEWFYRTANLYPAKTIGKPITELFPEPLPKRLLTAIDSSIHQGRSSVLSNKLNRSPFPLFNSKHERESNQRIHQMIYVRSLPIEGSHYSLVEIFDVTEASAREKHLRELANTAKESADALKGQQQKTQAIIDSARDCIVSLDENGCLTSANNATCALFGLPLEKLLGLQTSDLFALEARHYYNDGYSAMLRQWANLGEIVELSAKHADKSSIPVELSLNRCALDATTQYVGIIRDVSAKKKAEEHMYFLSRFDVLTGLANRTLFSERLLESIRRARRNNKKFAVVCLDLDRFKAINETLGYNMGDKVLRLIAERMRNTLRETDTISRTGGDEFMVIIEGLCRDIDIKLILEKLLDALRVPMNAQGHQLHATASAGVAFYPENGIDEQALYRNANIAMHNAKQERNAYNFFSENMNSRVGAWVKTVSELHRAVEEQQFEMHYQPQIDARSERVIGVEGLIRWNHPEKGRMSPDKFIPIAEDSGLIWQIGHIVVEQCCEAARLLSARVDHSIRVGINISPKQFQQNDLQALLVEQCRRHGIQTNQIELEITEGLLMKNTEKSEAIMNDLVRNGFTFSVDDFGTGYSSLAYLRRFPITTLKVDRSFVTDLPDDPDASALSRAIIHLAHSLRLNIVAEGVETAEQLEFLRDEGCEFIQGYYYAKPMPLDDLLPWIEEFSRND